MNAKVRDPISIFLVAALVVAMDAVVMPILRQSGRFFPQLSTMVVFVIDFSLVLLTGLAGLFFASRVGSPCWWRQGNGSLASRRMNHITVLLGLTVVVGNTLVNLAYHNQAAQLAPWLALLTPERAIALAFRAALNEEIFFRLFLFSLMAWVIGYFIRSQQASFVTGALASTIMYGLIHPGFVMAFLVGLALVYIYHQRGLLLAMTVHFFADVIPLALLSMML